MTHRESEAISYFYYDLLDEDGNEFDFDFDDEVEYFRDWLREIWPSFYPADGWENNELRLILENSFARIYVSMYGDILSLCLVKRQDIYDNEYGLAGGFVGSIANKFERLGTLSRLGTFSNGDSVYQLKA